MSWTVHDPVVKPIAVFTPPAPRFAVLFLHDFDEHLPTGNADLTAALAEHGLTCVAPWGGPSLWSDRSCHAFSDFGHYHRSDWFGTGERYVLRLASGSPDSHLSAPVRALIGVGIGGQAAVRLGLKYPDRFPVVAGWDSAFDFHELHGCGTLIETLYERKEQARQDTAVLQVRPPHVPPHIWFGCSPDSYWYRGNDRLHEKLSAVGVPHTFATDVPRPMATMVAFVADGLGKQSRRLL